MRQFIPTPNAIIKIDDKNCPSFIDLAVGARVMATKELATQIGINNGATGTLVGFGFLEQYLKNITFFHTLKDREILIVLAKMDEYFGANYLLI